MSAKRKSAPKAIVQQPVAQSYARFLAGIKERIRTAQVRAALAANAELVLHYWEIGGDILANQARQGWGAKVIDRLAADLQRDFPKLSGYSVRNLKYMRAFAESWPDRPIVHQLAAQIPWGHNCVLLDRVRDAGTRAFYIRQTIQHGWARSVLVHQIDTQLHKRQGLAPTNFTRALPAPESDLAREMLKDPYILQPAALDESANERALENALLARLKDFLIELGSGFAFVGNQVRLEVDGEEFFLDLLFYHTRLHCYIVIDLKVVDFQPEFAGKMNFYQTAVDNVFKSDKDAPTIGLILCRGKNKTIVEYTLRDVKSPMGVAEYRLLPPKLKTKLPPVSQLKDAVASLDVPKS
jgi:predicted nuclease of restriction endonuclease-like (RecB) superfamily